MPGHVRPYAEIRYVRRHDPSPSIPPQAMLTDGGELALIDVREELTFSQRHLLWARSVPLSRLELRFARLVPRHSTRIVLMRRRRRSGRTRRRRFSRAPATPTSPSSKAASPAGRRPASSCSPASTCRARRSASIVEHDSGTPSISADELDALINGGTDMVVLDSRPFDEFQRVSIPTATNVPGAELVLRIHDLAPSPDTLVVVNCAGRTRSIIGAQSLINAGMPEQGGGAAQRHHGLQPRRLHLRERQGQARADRSRRGARPRPGSWPARVAQRFGIERIDRASVERWRADGTRTLYLFDVRDPEEYAAGPCRRRDLRAGRPARAGDRPIRRHARRAHRADRRRTRCAR